MTHDTETSSSSHKTSESPRNAWNERDYFAWVKSPGINPMKVAAVVAGLAIFPPLGVGALLYFVWKDRRGARWDMNSAAFAGGPGLSRHGHGGCGRGGRRWTGNTAFDQHQSDVMHNLRAEREAFWAYRTEQRRKRDQEAYDAFRADATADAKPTSE